MIIPDVLIPGIEGLRFGRRLKDDPRTTIPVIILTALSSAEDKTGGGFEAERTIYVQAGQGFNFSCVKAFARLKMVSDELFQRTGTVADTGGSSACAKLSGRLSRRGRSAHSRSDENGAGTPAALDSGRRLFC